MLILKDSTLRQLVNSELVFDSRTFLVGVKALESVENYERESAYNTYFRTLKHVIEHIGNVASFFLTPSKQLFDLLDNDIACCTSLCT